MSLRSKPGGWEAVLGAIVWQTVVLLNSRALLAMLCLLHSWDTKRRLTSEVFVGEEERIILVADLGFAMILPVFRGEKAEAVLAEMATTFDLEVGGLLI